MACYDKINKGFIIFIMVRFVCYNYNLYCFHIKFNDGWMDMMTTKMTRTISNNNNITRLTLKFYN